ncbi:hypothetical protein WBP06_00510 [Novosphingobium sp. BL-8H]|uniref:hypothetical protein n=1 Tax=Novosphingobium sp. BL-8H TaxID=3127640 RepID=UPI00375815B5
MGTFAYGETAAFALARAKDERFDNAYIRGYASWRLNDLQGKAKDWVGSYARTRNNAKAIIEAAANRYGCVSSIVGCHMYIYRLSALERARQVAASRVVEPSDDWNCYIRNPSAALLERVKHMSPKNAAFVMGLGETIAAIAFRQPPKDKALKKLISATAGPRNRYAPTHILDCVESVIPVGRRHWDRIGAENEAEQRDMTAARSRLAGRYPFRATVKLDDLRQVESVVSKMPRSHGWSGRDLFLSERAAAILAKTIRVVRHKECAAA